jgi:hypothetical protein
MLRVKQGMEKTKGRAAGDETQERIIKILVVSNENVTMHVYVCVRMKTKT